MPSSENVQNARHGFRGPSGEGASGQTAVLQNPLDLRLYAVTDRAWVGNLTLEEQVEQALEGGATCIQLREKELGHDEFLEEALRMHVITRRHGVPLIINDNVEIAIESGAEGVHVGQDDMPVARVREMVGPGLVIGASASTLAESVEAEKAGADYLGVGAMFATPTKEDAESVSFDTLREICATVGIPVVAIGGIKRENINQFAHTGIAGISVVSAIFGAQDITSVTEELLREVAATPLGLS